MRLLITLALTAGGFIAGETAAAAWADVGADADRAAVWGAVLGAGFGYVFGGVAGRRFGRVVGEAEDLIPSRTAPEILVGGFGLLMGVIVGAIAAVPLIALLPSTIGWPLGALVVLVSSSFGWRLFAARSGELAEWAGLAKPIVPPGEENNTYRKGQTGCEAGTQSRWISPRDSLAAEVGST